MHRWDEETEALADAVLGYARDRLALDPVPLDGPAPIGALERDAGRSITAAGIGGAEALRRFAEVLAPACISTDHPRHLSFIPCAPTKAAVLFDLVVGASSIYGGSWLEGAGAVYAENEALAWLAGLAGLPAGAGGVFVQGGTIGNLSALVAARHAARAATGSGGRLAFAGSGEAHSSLRAAAAVMDVEFVEVEANEAGRLTGPALETALGRAGSAGLRVFAVVATAGTTNLGIVDDLGSIAPVAAAHGLWLHVDAAYGGAALAAPSARWRFAGIEAADSLVIDPHKWLFAPFDCAALLYRAPERARAAHTQHAGYLEPLAASEVMNPSDLAIHLTRRARGLPFWFSLATYGTDAYAAAIEATLSRAAQAAQAVAARPYLELVGAPELSICCFRRAGWGREEYYRWSARLLEAGEAFVTPTTHRGETVARLAIVNPRTSAADLEAVLDSMA